MLFLNLQVDDVINIIVTFYREIDNKTVIRTIRTSLKFMIVKGFSMKKYIINHRFYSKKIQRSCSLFIKYAQCPHSCKRYKIVKIQALIQQLAKQLEISVIILLLIYEYFEDKNLIHQMMFTICFDKYQLQTEIRKLEMDETIGSERFSFGEVMDTEYVAFQIVDTEIKLPYNPFVFDFQLCVFKSKPNYEDIGTSYQLSREKNNIFCRKRKVAKQWTDTQSIPVYLNAQIISQKHFSINQAYQLKDENSKHGTYIWIDRYHPLKIEVNDIFLIAKFPFQITRVQIQPKPLIEATYQGKKISVSEIKKIYLIGSHKKCDLVVPSLYEFEVCINLSNFTIFTNLDEEQACSDHGVWYRLRNDKANCRVKLEYGSLILADPYLLKVSS